VLPRRDDASKRNTKERPELRMGLSVASVRSTQVTARSKPQRPEVRLLREVADSGISVVSADPHRSPLSKAQTTITHPNQVGSIRRARRFRTTHSASENTGPKQERWPAIIRGWTRSG